MSLDIRRPPSFRALIQGAFLVWCLGMGVRFGLWLASLDAPGGPLAARPAGVEGFLPVGALVSLKHWMANGEFDAIHPAGLVLFLTFVAMSLLARRSFCSFVCPVGAISEALWKGGERLGGKALGIPRKPRGWSDLAARGLKYLLLAIFVKMVFIDMTGVEAAMVVASPYEKAADVMMWRFFAHIGPLALAVSAVLLLLSLLYKNSWCRYLCPYGALVGLAGMLSPWKIRREENICTGCGACSKACPSYLPVMERKVVRSPECTGCLACVSSCPAPGALRMGLPFLRREPPWWAYPATVLFLFALGVGWGMAAGHWTSALSPREVREALAELARR